MNPPLISLLSFLEGGEFLTGMRPVSDVQSLMDGKVLSIRCAFDFDEGDICQECQTPQQQGSPAYMMGNLQYICKSCNDKLNGNHENT